MERQEDRSPDVARAAQRLGRPRVRASLVLKRLCDVLLALVMLVALLPLLLVVVVLLTFGGGGWLERRERLGRDGRSLVLTRFVTF
jgi:lipopolysaccharide/colanic/teichoic acid biosynthesis glycosyltransferase